MLGGKPGARPYLPFVARREGDGEAGRDDGAPAWRQGERRVLREGRGEVEAGGSVGAAGRERQTCPVRAAA